jgi:hypothetical protein
MINSFHCDEKTVFFDFVILMSDKTMIEIRFIRKIGFAFVRHDSAEIVQAHLCSRCSVRSPTKRFFKNDEWSELCELYCGVELRTPNGEGSFLKHE